MENHFHLFVKVPEHQEVYVANKSGRDAWKL